jgi:Mg/Co/Ni transporter MgtE
MFSSLTQYSQDNHSLFSQQLSQQTLIVNISQQEIKKEIQQLDDDILEFLMNDYKSTKRKKLLLIKLD